MRTGLGMSGGFIEWRRRIKQSVTKNHASGDNTVIRLLVHKTFFGGERGTISKIRFMLILRARTVILYGEFKWQKYFL